MKSSPDYNQPDQMIAHKSILLVGPSCQRNSPRPPSLLALLCADDLAPRRRPPCLPPAPDGDLPSAPAASSCRAGRLSPAPPCSSAAGSRCSPAAAPRREAQGRAGPRRRQAEGRHLLRDADRHRRGLRQGSHSTVSFAFFLLFFFWHKQSSVLCSCFRCWLDWS